MFVYSFMNHLEFIIFSNLGTDPCQIHLLSNSVPRFTTLASLLLSSRYIDKVVCIRCREELICCLRLQLSLIKSCDVVFGLLRLLCPHDIDGLLCTFEVEFKLPVLFRELELLICGEHHSLLAAQVSKAESVSQIQGVWLIPTRGI